MNADSINIDEILHLLGPYSGRGMVWAILLYAIFFFSVVTMLMQSEKTIVPVLLMMVGLLAIVLAKLEVFPPRAFETFILNVVIFIPPVLVVGMTKNPKSRGPAILAFLLGAGYFFAYWLTFQS
jgi:hypothetical protein